MDLPKNVTVYSGKHKFSGKHGHKVSEHVSKAIEATEREHDSDSVYVIGKKPAKVAEIIKKANDKLKEAEKKQEEKPEDKPPVTGGNQQGLNTPRGQNK